MLLLSDDGTNSTNVVSSSNHNFTSDFEFEVVDDFVVSKVNFDCVVLLDQRVRESKSSSVVGNNIGDSLRAHSSSLNSAELEFSFAGGDLGKSESSFEVIQESIVGLALDKADDILMLD